MAWRWRVLAMGAWFGVACGDDPIENDSASPSSDDDDDDDDDESEDDDPSLEDGTSTGVDPTAGSSSESTGSSGVGAAESTSSGGSSVDSSSGGSSSGSSGADSDPTDGSGECDPFAQDCDAGEKCSAWADDGGNSWTATHCVPVDPNPAQPGEPCTVVGSPVSGVDDCDVGAMCWDVDFGTLMGTCIALCTGSVDDPECADDATACQISNNDSLNLCLPTCHPLLDDCPVGQGCYPGDQAFHCSPDASGGAGAQGDECMFVNVCDPGLACIDGDFLGCADAACCSSYCELSDPTSCTEFGLVCYPWYAEGQAPPGFEDVGICGA